MYQQDSSLYKQTIQPGHKIKELVKQELRIPEKLNRVIV